MCAQPTTVVYFVQSGSRGPIKIGIATDVKKRLSSMQTGNPVPMTLMASVPGSIEIERGLHQRFNVGRIANEWFERDTPGLMETVEHVLRHGELPSVAEPDPVWSFCGTCGWPMEDELEEHGMDECWRCIQDRLAKASDRPVSLKKTDLQVKDAA